MRRYLAAIAGFAILVGVFRPKAEATYEAFAQVLVTQKVWTCPMHREVLEDKAGVCPICKMDLVATLVEPAWICPIHGAVMEAKPGKCPLDGRDLLQVKVEVAWVCPNHPKEAQLEPGVCRIDNVPLQRTRSLRPHEDHMPKHGGIFFMAPDTWHHLEGTYPEPGLLRVYLYDNYSQALDVKTVRARAVLKEVYDEATKTTKEVGVFPLDASADGKSLEARVGDLPMPAEITVKVLFARAPASTRAPTEDRFDFIFAETSKEPDASVAAAQAAASMAIAAPTIQVTIPDNPDLIVAEIRARGDKVKDLLAKGAFMDVWVPALEAKDFALALDARLDTLPDDRRLDVKLAIKQLVRAAWLLDWYADLGDRQQVTDAYGIFGAAVEGIAGAYAR